MRGHCLRLLLTLPGMAIVFVALLFGMGVFADSHDPEEANPSCPSCVPPTPVGPTATPKPPTPVPCGPPPHGRHCTPVPPPPTPTLEPTPEPTPTETPITEPTPTTVPTPTTAPTPTTVSPPPPPPPPLPDVAAPAWITLTMGGSSTSEQGCTAQMTWERPTGAHQFQYRASEVGNEAQAGPDGEGPRAPDNETLFTKLWCSTKYEFKVKAQGNGQSYSSKWSAWTIKNETTGPYTPKAPAPTGLTVTAKTMTSISLTWNAVTNAEEYRVESRTTSSSAWNYAYTTSPSYTVSALSCGTDYEFQVRARGDGDPYSTKYGSPSSKVSASASACPPPPPPPPPTPQCPVPEDLGEFTADFTEVPPGDMSQVWNGDCGSPRSNNHYAQQYKFTLAEKTHVTIDLLKHSNVKGSLDPYLYLFQDPGNPTEDDDGHPGKSQYASRVSGTFDPGTYYIEATTSTKNPPSSGFLEKGNLSLKIEGEEPIPFDGHRKGHQADHTVQYRIGTMPTRTPALTATGERARAAAIVDPTPISSEPGVVIAEAIPTAVTAWNLAVATPWAGVDPGPQVLFCQRKVSPPQKGAHICPVNRLYNDGRTVTITAVDDATLCKTSPACVGPDDPDKDGHVTDQTMTISLKAEVYDSETRSLKSVVWTNAYWLHAKPPEASDKGVYIYLPGVLMHEFGHAAGLDDLYEYQKDDNKDGILEYVYPDYLMNWGKDTYKESPFMPPEKSGPAIPYQDIDYLWQVYRNEHGSEPHSR